MQVCFFLEVRGLICLEFADPIASPSEAWGLGSKRLVSILLSPFMFVLRSSFPIRSSGVPFSVLWSLAVLSRPRCVSFIIL